MSRARGESCCRCLLLQGEQRRGARGWWRWLWRRWRKCARGGKACGNGACRFRQTGPGARQLEYSVEDGRLRLLALLWLRTLCLGPGLLRLRARLQLHCYNVGAAAGRLWRRLLRAAMAAAAPCQLGPHDAAASAGRCWPTAARGLRRRQAPEVGLGGERGPACGSLRIQRLVQHRLTRRPRTRLLLLLLRLVLLLRLRGALVTRVLLGLVLRPLVPGATRALVAAGVGQLRARHRRVYLPNINIRFQSKTHPFWSVQQSPMRSLSSFAWPATQC